MNGKEQGYLGGIKMLPAKEGTCQECGVKHEEWQAHNKESLFYQYKFYDQHGRWPTWKDAISHCSEEVRQAWEKELRLKGINLHETEI